MNAGGETTCPRCGHSLQIEISAIVAAPGEDPAAALPVPVMPPGVLSGRELQIAAMVAEGTTNAAIAADLYLSRRTVDRHVANIFGKLGIHSRTQLAAWHALHNQQVTQPA